MDRPTAWRQAARSHHRSGRERYGAFSVDPAEFEAHVGACLERRWQRRRAARPELSEADEARDLVLRTHGDDLWLAFACEQGDEAAWSTLASTVLPSVPVPPGVDGAAGRQALLGDLARPTRAGHRCALGSYDGTGSLRSWLAVILRRRAVDRERTKASEDRTRQGLLEREPPTGPESDPLDRVLNEETKQAVGRAIEHLWKDLGATEQVLLQGRYRSGMQQKELARLVGLSETRVSRILGASVDRLRRALDRIGVEAPDRSTSLWTELSQVLADRLAILSPRSDRSGKERRPDD